MLSPLVLLLLPLFVFAQENGEPRKTYHLRTDGLYVTGYHVGAGLDDAVFLDNKETAGKGYLEGSKQLFDLGTPFSWGMVMSANPGYAGWKPVAINAGEGTTGFSIDENQKLQWDNDAFGGWLMCDWWHGVPQLFWIDRSRQGGYPNNCSETELTVEYI